MNDAIHNPGDAYVVAKFDDVNSNPPFPQISENVFLSVSWGNIAVQKMKTIPRVLNIYKICVF